MSDVLGGENWPFEEFLTGMGGDANFVYQNYPLVEELMNSLRQDIAVNKVGEANAEIDAALSTLMSTKGMDLVFTGAAPTSEIYGNVFAEIVIPALEGAADSIQARYDAIYDYENLEWYEQVGYGLANVLGGFTDGFLNVFEGIADCGATLLGGIVSIGSPEAADAIADWVARDMSREVSDDIVNAVGYVASGGANDHVAQDITDYGMDQSWGRRAANLAGNVAGYVVLGNGLGAGLGLTWGAGELGTGLITGLSGATWAGSIGAGLVGFGQGSERAFQQQAAAGEEYNYLAAFASGSAQGTMQFATGLALGGAVDRFAIWRAGGNSGGSSAAQGADDLTHGAVENTDNATSEVIEQGANNVADAAQTGDDVAASTTQSTDDLFQDIDNMNDAFELADEITSNPSQYVAEDVQRAQEILDRIDRATTPYSNQVTTADDILNNIDEAANIRQNPSEYFPEEVQWADEYLDRVNQMDFADDVFQNADQSDAFLDRMSGLFPQGENAAGAVSQGANNVAEAAAQSTDNAVEAVSQGANNVAATAAQSTDNVAEAAAQNTDNVAEAAAQTTDNVAEAAQHTNDAASATNGNGTLREQLQTVRETAAANRAAAGGNFATRAFEGVRGSLHPVVDPAHPVQQFRAEVANEVERSVATRALPMAIADRLGDVEADLVLGPVPEATGIQQPMPTGNSVTPINPDPTPPESTIDPGNGGGGGGGTPSGGGGTPYNSSDGSSPYTPSTPEPTPAVTPMPTITISPTPDPTPKPTPEPTIYNPTPDPTHWTPEPTIYNPTPGPTIYVPTPAPTIYNPVPGPAPVPNPDPQPTDPGFEYDGTQTGDLEAVSSLDELLDDSDDTIDEIFANKVKRIPQSSKPIQKSKSSSSSSVIPIAAGLTAAAAAGLGAKAYIDHKRANEVDDDEEYDEDYDEDFVADGWSEDGDAETLDISYDDDNVDYVNQDKQDEDEYYRASENTSLIGENEELEEF